MKHDDYAQRRADEYADKTLTDLLTGVDTYRPRPRTLRALLRFAYLAGFELGRGVYR